MFRKKPMEVNLAEKEYEHRLDLLWSIGDKVEGYAQGILWAELPLQVLPSDTPEYKAAQKQADDYRHYLLMEMGNYDTERHALISYCERMKSEMRPQYAMQIRTPRPSIELVRDAIHDIAKNGYFYFDNYIKKY